MCFEPCLICTCEVPTGTDRRPRHDGSGHGPIWPNVLWCHLQGVEMGVFGCSARLSTACVRWPLQRSFVGTIVGRRSTSSHMFAGFLPANPRYYMNYLDEDFIARTRRSQSAVYMSRLALFRYLINACRRFT